MNDTESGNATKSLHKRLHANPKLGRKHVSPFISWRFYFFFLYNFQTFFSAPGCTDNLHIPYIPELFFFPPSVRFSNKAKLQ